MRGKLCGWVHSTNATAIRFGTWASTWESVGSGIVMSGRGCGLTRRLRADIDRCKTATIRVPHRGMQRRTDANNRDSEPSSWTALPKEAGMAEPSLTQLSYVHGASPVPLLGETI